MSLSAIAGETMFGLAVETSSTVYSAFARGRNDMTKETKSDIKPLVVTAKQVRKMLCVSDSTIRVLVCQKGFLVLLT